MYQKFNGVAFENEKHDCGHHHIHYPLLSQADEAAAKAKESSDEAMIFLTLDDGEIRTKNDWNIYFRMNKKAKFGVW